MNNNNQDQFKTQNDGQVSNQGTASQLSNEQNIRHNVQQPEQNTQQPIWNNMDPNVPSGQFGGPNAGANVQQNLNTINKSATVDADTRQSFQGLAYQQANTLHQGNLINTTPPAQQNGNQDVQQGGSPQLQHNGVQQPGQNGNQQFGLGGAQQFGQSVNQQPQQAEAQQFGQSVNQQFGQVGARQFGQSGNQQPQQAGAQQFGQSGNQQFGQAGAQQYGQGGNQQFGQAGASQYGQGGNQQFQQGQQNYNYQSSNKSSSSNKGAQKHIGLFLPTAVLAAVAAVYNLNISAGFDDFGWLFDSSILWNAAGDMTKSAAIAMFTVCGLTLVGWLKDNRWFILGAIIASAFGMYFYSYAAIATIVLLIIGFVFMTKDSKKHNNFY